MRYFALLFPTILLCSHLFNTTRACAGEPVNVDWSALTDIDRRPLPLEGAKWKVVCFLGAECPLARLYGPRLERLRAEFAEKGVQLIGINSNPQDSAADCRDYVKTFKLTFPLIKDDTQQLARSFGAERTPEVFVLDATNRIRYRGRIDDQFEPGVFRAEPSTHELRAAIEAVVGGRKVAVAETKAVGCLITFVKEKPKLPVDSASAVTFTRDVAPILNEHCVECHRAGEIGPFALTDYDEVVGWGEMMLEVIEQNRMPPWHADPRFGKYVGARRMLEADRKRLAAWVEQGMPQGDPAELPPQPKYAAGWHLSTSPDVEFPMRDRPFVVPPEGTVEYQYFVVDPKWEEDRWVRAAQVIPGDSSVVHHCIVFVRPPDGTQTSGVGWLGGYVPGQRTGTLPAGHARLVPAGSRLVFQLHYTPNGRETKDATRLGVWFSDAAEVTHEVSTRVALDHRFEIPPGAKNHVVKMELDRFARDSRLLGMMPHMHLRGKSFRLDVRRKQQETLLSVPHYDFNWQHWYQLEEPIALDEVESLEMEVRFDNSARNPTNPDPKQYVTWGDQTWQEMAIAFFDIAHPRGEPLVFVEAEEKPADVARRNALIAVEVAKFLKQLDKDGDGVIEPDETPEAFRRFGFRRFDRNDDRRIDRGEMEAEAARRIDD